MYQKTKLSIATFIVGLILIQPQLAKAEKYEVDAVHSAIAFKIKHLGISDFYGRFNDPQGKVKYDEKNPEKSTFHIWVKTSSVDTGNKDRDEHIQDEEMLNTEKYSKIEFKSKKVTKGKEKFLNVTGDLIFLGVTKEIKVNIELGGCQEARGESKCGFGTTFTIKRSDFGMEKSKWLGDDVTLYVGLECVKQE